MRDYREYLFLVKETYITNINIYERENKIIRNLF